MQQRLRTYDLTYVAVWIHRFSGADIVRPDLHVTDDDMTANKCHNCDARAQYDNVNPVCGGASLPCGLP